MSSGSRIPSHLGETLLPVVTLLPADRRSRALLKAEVCDPSWSQFVVATRARMPLLTAHDFEEAKAWQKSRTTAAYNSLPAGMAGL